MVSDYDGRNRIIMEEKLAQIEKEKNEGLKEKDEEGKKEPKENTIQANKKEKRIDESSEIHFGKPPGNTSLAIMKCNFIQ